MYVNKGGGGEPLGEGGGGGGGDAHACYRTFVLVFV